MEFNDLKLGQMELAFSEEILCKKSQNILSVNAC